PYERRILNIRVAPDDVGPMIGLANVTSDAQNGHIHTIEVKANAVFQGAPDVEIEYNGVIGPNVQACASGACGDCTDTNGDGKPDRCLMGQPLDFGSVGLGSQGNV